MVYKGLNVIFVVSSFLVEIELIIIFCGRNTQKTNRPIFNYLKNIMFQ